MSIKENWHVNKYREDHESDEHWLLRKSFIERWKDEFPEDRLVCLAQVFANIEFMGCRYPTEVMQEVARLSHDVAKQYRNIKKSKLQRTFVSASNAAADRARGIKREGGVIKDVSSEKSAKIAFVPQGHVDNNHAVNNSVDSNFNNEESNAHNDKLNIVDEEKINENHTSQAVDPNEYLKDMQNIKCLDVRSFSERMFNSTFGKMVLLIRPWTNRLSNIQSSCQVCYIPLTSTYEKNCFSLIINGILIAQATGISKAEARSIVEIIAWNRLKQEVISVLTKEQWIAQGDRISVSDVSGKRHQFGTPVENSVATKMMKLMGWKGGGLGAESQGIAEPIKPNLQMVNRAGLGSDTTDIRQMKRAGQDLMKRYIASDTIDVDLVFSSDFSKEERAVMHQCAQRVGLASKSYGGADRFLVVKKKLDPFSLVRAVIEKGGNTPKYQVFLPVALRRR